jgi:hypothetical protein
MRWPCDSAEPHRRPPCPTADEQRSDPRHRVHFGGEATLDAAAVRIGRSGHCSVEEQSNVDRNAGGNRLFDRGNAGAIAGDLDEQVRTPCTA